MRYYALRLAKDRKLMINDYRKDAWSIKQETATIIFVLLSRKIVPPVKRKDERNEKLKPNIYKYIFTCSSNIFRNCKKREKETIEH